MHGLIASQRTPQSIGHNNPMLGHVTTAVPHRRSEIIVTYENQDVALPKMSASLPVRMAVAKLAAST
jgi:hypothetical protein